MVATLGNVGTKGHIPEPLVTVGMPVYNGAKHLEVALDSLLAQTYKNLIIVISDNASTDSTRRLCESYATRDSRIRYECQPSNRGASWNFNRVAELAEGEYFMWAAHDDLWHPECLSASVNALELFPEAVVCYHYAQPVDSSGRPEGGPLTGLTADAPTAAERWVRVFSHWRIHASIYGVIRLRAMKLVRQVQVALGADLAFISEMALHGGIIQVPAVLSWKRGPAEGRTYRTAAEMLAYLGAVSKGRILFPEAHITKSAIDGLLGARVSTVTKAVALASALAIYGSKHLSVDVKVALYQAGFKPRSR